MQRRTLLNLGIAGASLALLGGGSAILFRTAWGNGRLSLEGENVLAAVARGVLDGSLPADDVERRLALTAHLERMNLTLRSMAPSAQREVGKLLAILASPAGRIALVALATDWETASALQIQSGLQAMRTSRLIIRRQTYHAMRDLTHAAYFADEATWPQLGYPGPANLE